MNGVRDGHNWRIIGASVTGAAHRRAGQERQDAIAFWPPGRDGGASGVMAVSDGHGSPQHFRSAVGAALAVDAALPVLRQYLGAGSTDDADQLPRRLVQAWRDAVTSHLAGHPFTTKEWRALEDILPGVQRDIEANPSVAYGATLLAVAVHDASILYLQLGDGDILSVDDRGETTRMFQPDPRLIANQTHSLCQADAVESFRMRLATGEDAVPSLVVVATDGYANAFQTDADFRLIGKDYLAMLRDEGPDRTAARLERFLNDASTNGSGDDITLGLLARLGPASTGAAPGPVRREEPAEHLETPGRPRGGDADSRPHPQTVDDTAASARRAAAKRWGAIALIASLVLAAVFFGTHVLRNRPGSAPANPAAPVLVLRAGTAAVPLAPGAVVRAKDLALDPATFGDRVAQVVPSPVGKGIGLKNVSPVTWVLIQGAERRTAGPGSTVPIAPGMRIRMGAVDLAVERR
jgi:serine/threonine protein phosphatase PrpC